MLFYVCVCVFWGGRGCGGWGGGGRCRVPRGVVITVFLTNSPVSPQTRRCYELQKDLSFGRQGHMSYGSIP